VNIYEKLQTCRVELQNSNLKKTGYNEYSNYHYFELGDFIPKVNELFLKYKLCGLVSFGTDVAALTIVNIEKPDEREIFTSPMAEANLKGCHAVQNLGAAQTYQRRYLYMAAMEITESDILDSGSKVDNGKLEKKDKGKKPSGNNGKPKNSRATREQINNITALAKRKGMEGPAFWDYLKDMQDNGKISSQYAYDTGKQIQWTVKDIEALEADLDLPF
jgi:hypothetical protein